MVSAIAKEVELVGTTRATKSFCLRDNTGLSERTDESVSCVGTETTMVTDKMLINSVKVGGRRQNVINWPTREMVVMPGSTERQ